MDFNPRSPRGERHEHARYDEEAAEFQSTLPSRGATGLRVTRCKALDISIHAPLAGSDDHKRCHHVRDDRFQSTLPSRGATGIIDVTSVFINDFNPRSPRGERRLDPRTMSSEQRFQSTLPSRGATAERDGLPWSRRISIHAPLAGSDQGIAYSDRRLKISIHAPLAGSDSIPAALLTTPTIFQSTLPSRGATAAAAGTLHPFQYFNPRSPRGERRMIRYSLERAQGFQSTLPSRGATKDWESGRGVCDISIHAPLAGSDFGALINGIQATKFQSTLPSRGATRALCTSSPEDPYFNPRSPRGERRLVRYDRHAFAKFQSTLPSRGATVKQTNITSCFVIKIACFPRYVQRSR